MAASLAHAHLVDVEEMGEYQRFVEYASTQPHNLVDILAAIPRSGQPSFAPLAALSTLVETQAGPWPVLELQRTHTELWKLLPEDARAGHASRAGQRLIEHVSRQCKASYSSLVDLCHPESASVAIIDPESGRTASHHKLTAVISNFRLPVASASGQPKPVVAISLPNGPLLAMTVLATATYYTAAPVAHGSGVGAEQFKADVLQSQSNAVIASMHDVNRLGLRDSWLADAGIAVLLADLTDDMDVSITDLNQRSLDSSRFHASRNTADDTGIMLSTSGTSGTKKLVPLSIHSMVRGVAMVEKSWGLSPSMRCLNQMPLNHVGGLIRNLFTPVFSGGSVICCSAFDANLFWDCVEDYAPTWYYASPSMHQVILDAASERPESVAKSQIRLIGNAAGALLPSLARRLLHVFSTTVTECTVLPSYGMTECMPISTPPLDYRLDKTGTSGISAGPEICIMNGRNEREVGDAVGRICVRGAPVFGGYLTADQVVDRSCFDANGWFDTGDMGYLDDQGYLYITGRSKEVINRGGELISPFEVEDAVVAAANKRGSPIYGRVSKAIAFSVTHDVLQEVVGLAVATPDGALRPCLRTVQQSVKAELSQAKWPVVLVYMDGGVPTNNNKVVRIRLADRLQLPPVSDRTPPAGRHFEAICPPPNTALSVCIGSRPLVACHEALRSACESVVPRAFEYWVHAEGQLYPHLVLGPKSGRERGVVNKQSLLEEISGRVHGYAIPIAVHQLDGPLPRDERGHVDGDAIHATLSSPTPTAATTSAPGTGSASTEATISRVFAQVLSLPVGEINASSDFFELGGDSMGAGRLLNALRKEYAVRLPISMLFQNPQVHQLAQAVADKLAPSTTSDDSQTGVRTGSDARRPPPPLLPGCEKTCPSTNPLLMMLQLVPLAVVYPMKRALTWTVLVYMLSETQDWPTNASVPGRLVDLVVSIAVGASVTRMVAPCVAIAFKWLVIGRYREGLFPMWGSYHTRWWLVQKTVATCGMGVFGVFNWSRVRYHRLLGAKIGTNVTIPKGVAMGEWDLLTIGDNVVLEKSIVRPFAAERNTTMYLGRIHIGANASIGLSSIVAAGTDVPANACMGPNSSSWEADAFDEANRHLATDTIPAAHWALDLLVGLPLHLLTALVGSLPWLGCLVALVAHETQPMPDMLRAVIVWFASRHRVGYHYLALAAHVALGPVFFFGAVLAIKKLFDLGGGKIQPSRADERSAWTTFRMQWLRTAMPAARFHKLTALFGTHYASTSAFARALGARVGARVYWPGTGPSIQDFDLLDIGDDVVFGSRSHLVTSDGTGSEHVRIRSGAMVADRVVLLPGVHVGGRTVMGSGALTRRNRRYADGTTWVGAKRGEAVCLSLDTASPSPSPPSHPATPPRLAHISSLNSTRTTLVKGFASGPSSLSGIETTASRDDLGSPVGSTDDCPSAETRTARRRPPRPDTAPPPRPDTASPGGAGAADEEKKGEEAGEEGCSPFGRAFYQGQAPYRVWTQAEIFVYSTAIAVANGVYWNVGSVSAVQVVARLLTEPEPGPRRAAAVFLRDGARWRAARVYAVVWGWMVGVTAVQSVCVVGLLVAAKWALVGRRRRGNYDWDRSPYCQRWQLFLRLETFRRHCYGGHGVLGLLTGTHWLTLYFRALGARIGRDCALFAGGLPSLLFTEPDLLTLGDRVAVDDASLVAHINTRGRFDLNPLAVGDRAVLRSGSRLLSGATMEADSCLLEHTLVMAGDVVDAAATLQGWPADDFAANRIPTMEPAQCWKVAVKA